MSILNFLLSYVEHEKDLIASGPGKQCKYHFQDFTFCSVRCVWVCQIHILTVAIQNDLRSHQG